MDTPASLHPSHHPLPVHQALASASSTSAVRHSLAHSPPCSPSLSLAALSPRPLPPPPPSLSVSGTLMPYNAVVALTQYVLRMGSFLSGKTATLTTTTMTGVHSSSSSSHAASVCTSEPADPSSSSSGLAACLQSTIHGVCVPPFLPPCLPASLPSPAAAPPLALPQAWTRC